MAHGYSINVAQGGHSDEHPTALPREAVAYTLHRTIECGPGLSERATIDALDTLYRMAVLQDGRSFTITERVRRHVEAMAREAAAREHPDSSFREDFAHVAEHMAGLYSVAHDAVEGLTVLSQRRCDDECSTTARNLALR